MADKYFRVGSVTDVFGYDDVDYDSAIETDAPIKAGDPIDPNDVVTLGSMTGDLTGYFLLAGRAGGQIAYGGTGAGEDVEFHSTSNVTKGSIILHDKVEIYDILVAPKTSGYGIKIDITTPTWGWRDLIGNITNTGGLNKPTNATYNGGITQFQFVAGDESVLEFHIPHDYVVGTDIYLHVHWSHISTLVTGGTITFTAESSYAKGHNQVPFSAPVTGTFTGTASTIQYQHIISEVQFSATSPSGLQLDTDNLEPDGVILIRLEMTTNNITSSGAIPNPFIHFVDIHYQSTNISTKNKVPSFWA